MNRARLLKSTLCMASAVTVLFAANTAPEAVASNVTNDVATQHVTYLDENTSQNSLAGISLSLDKYYTVVLKDADTKSGDLQVASTNTAEKEAPKATPEPTKAPEKKKSEYENTGISVAPNYVNVRTEANTEGEVVGKLYKGAAATIQETKGDWVKIKSGKVSGYIKKEFLAIGFSAEELVDKYGTRSATVKGTPTLRLREEKNTESRTLTLIAEGESYDVVKVEDEWVKISIDDDIIGYVSKDYVDITVEFQKAVSVKEEQEELARQEAAKQAEEEAIKRQEEANKNNNTNKNNNSNNSSNKNDSNKVDSNKNNNTSNKNEPSKEETTVTSGKAKDVVNFALKFVGNRYVYGGTSLTNGTDCSGFTMQVYKHFGYKIPRDSRSQCTSAGKKVSLSSLKAGDLIFYKRNGRVNHVALYIGGGKVVHASTPSSGIKVSKYNYRSPYMARRIIN